MILVFESRDSVDAHPLIHKGPKENKRQMKNSPLLLPACLSWNISFFPAFGLGFIPLIPWSSGFQTWTKIMLLDSLGLQITDRGS